MTSTSPSSTGARCLVTREMLEDQPDLLLQIQARQMDSALRAVAAAADAAEEGK